jgi:hypothetical protein
MKEGGSKITYNLLINPFLQVKNKVGKAKNKKS